MALVLNLGSQMVGGGQYIKAQPEQWVETDLEFLMEATTASAGPGGRTGFILGQQEKRPPYGNTHTLELTFEGDGFLLGKVGHPWKGYRSVPEHRVCMHKVPSSNLDPAQGLGVSFEFGAKWTMGLIWGQNLTIEQAILSGKDPNFWVRHFNVCQPMVGSVDGLPDSIGGSHIWHSGRAQKCFCWCKAALILLKGPLLSISSLNTPALPVTSSEYWALFGFLDHLQWCFIITYHINLVRALTNINDIQTPLPAWLRWRVFMQVNAPSYFVPFGLLSQTSHIHGPVSSFC